jgi:hypothetical protein
MTRIITLQARAYVNHGRWVADCPVDCGAALKLDNGQTSFACPECMTISSIDWPANVAGIWEALLERRNPKTRNWYPPDHPLAIKGGLPHGQTVKDLEAETEEHESWPGQLL